jgi:hypothetical protein
MMTMLEFLEVFIGLVLSWLGVAFLLGGAGLWWLLVLLFAQLFYHGNGKAAANWAIWIAFLTLLIGGIVFLYILFGEQWAKITAMMLLGCILPLILSVVLTISE